MPAYNAPKDVGRWAGVALAVRTISCQLTPTQPAWALHGSLDTRYTRYEYMYLPYTTRATLLVNARLWTYMLCPSTADLTRATPMVVAWVIRTYIQITYDGIVAYITRA